MLGYCHISHWCLCHMRRQVSLCEGPKLILFARILLARWVGITYTWGHLLPLSSLGDSRTSQFSSGNLYHWNPTNVWVPITYSGPSLHRSTTSWRHGSNLSTLESSGFQGVSHHIYYPPDHTTWELLGFRLTFTLLLCKEPMCLPPFKEESCQNTTGHDMSG